MIFSKRSHEGCLMIDHRASPGIPRAKAIEMGMDPALVGEGKLFETVTLGCNHCGGCWVKNPDRQRDRHHCVKCDRYLCDWCHAETTKPDYVHRSFQELVDIVRSGKFIIAGGYAHAPLLIPSNGG